MKMSHWAVGTVGVVLLQGCSSSSGGGGGGGMPSNDGGAGSDATQGLEGGGNGSDAEADTGPVVDGGGGVLEASADASGDGGSVDGGSDAVACSGEWLDASWIYPEVMPDAGAVILHAAGSGTQNYECEAVDPDSDAGPTYEWVFTGPQANLDDCNAALIGHHFASEAGASAPEWQTLDGTYVIGSKKVSFIPDGGAESIPWLLLEATAHGGTGTLSNANWISRANTAGGITPTTACTVSNVGVTQDVDYTADYFFWGP
jgi:hypothetical protein